MHIKVEAAGARYRARKLQMVKMQAVKRKE